MKRAVRGKSELVLTGLELVQKLAVLVPPRRFHGVRFHGVFAPNAKLRKVVVPEKPKAAPPVDDAAKLPPRAPLVNTYRIDWASLLKRVFAVDVLKCTRCEGRLRVLAVVDEPGAVKRVLEHVGLPAVPIDIAPARGPPQPELFDVA